MPFYELAAPSTHRLDIGVTRLKYVLTDVDSCRRLPQSNLQNYNPFHHGGHHEAILLLQRSKFKNRNYLCRSADLGECIQISVSGKKSNYTYMLGLNFVQGSFRAGIVSDFKYINTSMTKIQEKELQNISSSSTLRLCLISLQTQPATF